MQDCVTGMTPRKLVNRHNPNQYYIDFYNRLQETEEFWIFPSPQTVRKFSKKHWDVVKIESKI